MRHELRIGFLGGGQMGCALANALIKAGLAPQQLAVAESDPQTRAHVMQQLGIEAVASAEDLPNELTVLLLAVKPQDLSAALTPLRDRLADDTTLIISIAAGITCQQLSKLCAGATRIVRAMPNRPASLGVGATALYADKTMTAEDRQIAETLLAAAGQVEWIDHESLMDVVTALSGSGPAYFFLLAEAMMEEAIAQGLPADVARRLAAATLQGAGAMCAQTDDLAVLRESVTSKGGTTAAALAQFNAGKLGEIVTKAMQAAVHRGQALSQQTSGGA
jgi:pyrroline-5-carboxylate reductase